MKYYEREAAKKAVVKKQSAPRAKKQVGFSGTQSGMTEEQHGGVEYLLEKLNPDVVHHGECIGADAQFHRISKKQGKDIIGHPPSVKTKQAKTLTGFADRRKPKKYMDRNQDIVDESSVLIATPKLPEKSDPYSGTWATVRRAGKAHKQKPYIIWPDGRIERYEAQ